MKVRRQVAALEPMILDPLHGLKGEDWHRAPNGRWSIAQILSHLAIGLDAVGLKLEERAERRDLRRRATPKQHLIRHLILGVGKIPSGHKTPERSSPGERPDPELTTAQYRMGVERLARLVDTWPSAQQERIFVRHPVVGDLNLPEWVRFFYVHNRHHVHQIEVRLRWLKQQKHQGRKGQKGLGRQTGQGQKRQKGQKGQKGR
jgi:hypothetical protein